MLQGNGEFFSSWYWGSLMGSNRRYLGRTDQLTRLWQSMWCRGSWVQKSHPWESMRRVNMGKTTHPIGKKLFLFTVPKSNGERWSSIASGERGIPFQSFIHIYSERDWRLLTAAIPFLCSYPWYRPFQKPRISLYLTISNLCSNPYRCKGPVVDSGPGEKFMMRPTAVPSNLLTVYLQIFDGQN